MPAASVVSFGEEWNYFNFTDFRINWLKHTVANPFGSIGAFKGILIVNSEGGGDGAQTQWFAKYGARQYSIPRCVHYNGAIK